MRFKKPKYQRLLAIIPSHRGFGYAIFDGIMLVDWGGKVLGGDLNAASLHEATYLLQQYQPDVLVLEDIANTKRGERIQALVRALVDLGKAHKVTVKHYSRDQVNKVFFQRGEGTKDELADLVAKEFPEELGHRLPPRRQAWTSEDYRLAMFDAVAWAITAGEC
jgi:Holliday junction resolvasome RuvABC endonuclease subunit